MKYLDIYLDDHWAGAGAGKALGRRLARENAATEWASELRVVADQIADDDRTLALIRAALGVTGGSVKRVGAMVLERVSRLKLNGTLIDYSPLSRVIETEALLAGVSGKRRLWRALRVAETEDERLAPFDFADLEQRADDQLEVLRRFHEYACVEAFSRPS